MSGPLYPRCRTHPSNCSRPAFTRIELCAVLCGIGLLTLVIAPVLANTNADSERAGCFNNLRLIGRGIATWTADHQQRLPWRVNLSEGGTLPDVYSGNKPGAAWYEFSVLSNGFGTPKILACPSDIGVNPATSFSEYLRAGFRGDATSYNLALDVFPEIPQAWVVSDRNFKADSGFSECSAKVYNADTISPNSTSLAWTNRIHGPNSGHLLLNDGSVVFTDNATLRNLATRAPDFQGSTHFLKAR